jgi:hypothetical protein
MKSDDNKEKELSQTYFAKKKEEMEEKMERKTESSPKKIRRADFTEISTCWTK